MASKLNLSNEQKETVTWMAKFAAGILVIGFIEPITPLSDFIQPFKLFSVLLHEWGHAFTSFLTGGRVISITVAANEGGLTTFTGGNRFLSLPAGYLGAAAWGGFLVYSSFSNYWSQIASVALAAAMGFALIYAGNQLTQSIILFTFAIIGGLLYYQDGKYLRYYIIFLATMVSIFSLLDIYDDLINRNIATSDGSVFASISGGNKTGKYYGQIWLVLASIMVGTGFYFGVQKFKSPGPLTPIKKLFGK